MSEHKCMTSHEAAKWLLEYAKISVDSSTLRKWLAQGRVRRCAANPSRLDFAHLKQGVDSGRLPPQRGRKTRPEEVGAAIVTLAESLTPDDYWALHNGTADASLTDGDIARVFGDVLRNAGVKCEIPGEGNKSNH